jgi:hypothetical protein
MIVKKITNKIIDKFIVEIKQPENMNKLKEQILNPLIKYTYQQLYPYFLISSILFILTFILALLIFMILLKQIIRKI